jgi:MFS family permease
MRLFQPLRLPPVALLWGGLSLSAMGDQIFGVALSWIATDVFGAAAGYLVALQALTILLVALFSGNLADRWDPLRCMLGADLVRAAALLLLVGLWLALASPTAPGLALTVIVLAIGQALFQPALQSVLPALVGQPGLLPAANGLFDGTDRSARLLGPGLLAILAGAIPLMHFLTINAASFLLSAGALVLIMRHHRPAGLGGAAGATGALPALDGIRRGIRAMRRHRLLGYVLASAGPLQGAWFAVFFLGLPLLLQQDGHGIGTYGVLIAAYGGANLLSNLVCGSLELPQRPQFRMFGSSLLVGTGMAAFAFIGGLPAEWQMTGFLAAALVSGIAGPLKDIPVAVLRQSRIPAGEIQAATRAMLAATSTGTLAVMLALPALLAWLPLAPVLFGCGAVAFGVGLIGLIRHAGWQEAPDPAPP